MPEFTPVFNPPGCQVEAVEPIDALPEIVCELPDPELSPLLDCADPGVPERVRPGLPGPRGKSGPIGPDGYAGDNGPEGAQGAKGPNGEVGPIGATGYRGFRGGRGPQGPEGLQGPAGARGTQGPRGKTGVQGPQGPDGDQGNIGETGSQGPPGATGPQGDKFAVVALPAHEIVGLYCTEATEVRFVDIVTFELRQAKQTVSIDARYIGVCADNSIVVTDVVPALPVRVTATLADGALQLSAPEFSEPCLVSVRLSGVRRNCDELRLTPSSREEMISNNRRWDSAIN